ncbi:MAG: hypothetical protein IJA79_08785 [Desulfovibrio sp.]|nr:hypothetical protein [Desulfovibrio sp.]
MRVAIITGTGEASIKSCNRLVELLKDEADTFIVQEKSLTMKKICHIILKRIKSKGFINALGMIFGYLFGMLQPSKKIDPTYTINYKTTAINKDVCAETKICEFTADYIVTIGCSLLKKTLLNKLNTPIINIHPGINPRYRGAGNVWACFDNDFSTTGVTIHKIDAGIDTGEIISNRFIDFKQARINFVNMNAICMEEGSYLVYDFLCQNKKSIDIDVTKLQSNFRGFPTFFEILKAKNNFQKNKLV